MPPPSTPPPRPAPASNTRPTAATAPSTKAGPPSPTGPTLTPCTPPIHPLPSPPNSPLPQNTLTTRPQHSWSANSATSAGACKWLGLDPNSDAENDAVKAAVKQAGSDSGLDPRFILAAVFQESAGCVRVKTSYSPNLGIRNPGLLQGPDGEHTCNDPEAGVDMLNPCPEEQIYGESRPNIPLALDKIHQERG